MGYSFAVCSIRLLNKHAGVDQRITILFVVRPGSQITNYYIGMRAINYEEVDMDNYKNEVSIKLAEVWESAKRNNKTAQSNQKLQYDRNSKPPKFRVGDRVFVYNYAICQSMQSL